MGFGGSFETLPLKDEYCHGSESGWLDTFDSTLWSKEMSGIVLCNKGETVSETAFEAQFYI